MYHKHNTFFLGPSFWGLINPDWSLCNGGMSQSPINIKPQNVLFDPRLKDMIIGETKVSKAAVFWSITSWPLIKAAL